MIKAEKKIHIYYIACISAVILWSGSFIATKIAYETFAPIQLGITRTFFAAIIFLLLRMITKNKDKLQKKDRKRVAISALFGITLYFALENVGVSMTSASNAALIVASFPAVTTFLEFFIYNSKPTFRKLLGILLAIMGVVILTQANVEESVQSFWGNLILIGAGIVWALYNFITRNLTTKYSAMTLTYYQMLIGTVWFLPFVLLEAKPWRIPNVTSMNALIFLSVGCSVAAFVLYNFGLKKLSASVSVSLMNLVPVLGLVLSVVILDERVSFIQITGGIIVIIGVVLSSMAKKEISEKLTSKSSLTLHGE